METTHRVVVGDARDLSTLSDASVDLVVTSPPYPMIEMWDAVFGELDPTVTDRLEAGDGDGAFEAMHCLLDEVWDELARVVDDGGIVCVNVGDATRTLDGSFRVYPNHARVGTALEERGFQPLPEVLWRKPTNSAAKFMGSGMIPPNAYVTLEHEFILVFRKGRDRREFEPGAPRRYEAAYFWEERNRWFSDVWTDVRGVFQSLEDGPHRERSGAFPLTIPYRLVCMHSVYGDTVLDPFWGTGTTAFAAMCAGRNSVGYEIDPSFVDVFDERIPGVPSVSKAIGRERLERHEDFLEERAETPEYRSRHYGFPVVTSMEEDIRLYAVSDVDGVDGTYVASHCPLE